MKLTMKAVEELERIIKDKRYSNEFLGSYIRVLCQEKGSPTAQILKDQDVLGEAREYFDNLSDADCDQDGFIPNKEMTLLVEIEAALLPKE